MQFFSISQLAEYSGIKPHTIRIWEQRYNALIPERSPGNTRFYNNSQLRRLLNLVTLNQNGHKIADLSKMPDKVLFQMVMKSEESSVLNNPHELYIGQLIAAGMNYDEAHFDKILSHILLRYGLRDAYVQVIYPMLTRIGILWTSNNIPVGQEHFMSNLLRQKLFTAINLLPPETSKETWLLFLPEDELHEIGLLVSCYLIRLSGKKVIYLGANVPFESIKVAIDDVKPDNLFIFMVHHTVPENFQLYCDKLLKEFKGVLFIACKDNLMSSLKPGKRLQLLPTVESLQEKLNN